MASAPPLHSTNSPMKNNIRFQKGFTLAEVMIAVVITLILAGYKLYPMYLEARTTKSAAQGLQLATMGNSVATYSTKFYGPLVNNTAIAGVANVYAPTVDELKTLGLLPSNFSTVNMYGGGYAARVTRSPAGCVAPNCDIENLVYLTNAIVNPANGRVDGAVLGQASRTLGADGGYSDTASPGTITGPSGAWSVANPVVNASTGQPVAGILAMRSGYNSSTLAQFMRRDGQLPATGAQDMGNQDVNNVNGLRSTTITNSGSATVGGSMGVSGLTSTSGIANNGNLSNTGNATVGGTFGVTGLTTTTGITNNGSLSNTGNIINGGNLTNAGTATVTGATTLGGTLAVSGTTTARGITNIGNISTSGDMETGRLYLRTVVANGASCAGLTGYQAATAAGSIASCINGTWQTPAANIPPPSPCSSQTVYFQGCTGSLPYTQHGQNANATVTSGSGSAVYACNNGTWAFQSGNCTPPPSNCSSTTLSWSGSGASCSGSTGSISHGSGKYVNSTNGNSGSVYASCNNGNISTSGPNCSPSTTTYSSPRTVEGYSVAANPSNRAAFCQSKGKSVYGNGAESDRGGQSVSVCFSIDSALRCTNPTNGPASCSSMNYGNPGCWVQTSITCQ